MYAENLSSPVAVEIPRQCNINYRLVLSVQVLHAINDITVHNIDPMHGIRYTVAFDGEQYAEEIIGDGIVFQTPAEVAEEAMKEQVWEDYQIKQRNPEYPTPSEQGITFKTPTAEDLDINPDDIPF